LTGIATKEQKALDRIMGDDSDYYRDEDSAFLALVNDKPALA